MQAVAAPRSEQPDAGPGPARLGVLAAVAVAQLFAFWLLCSHQVRKAEVRRAEWQVQQMALADCLEYMPGSTIASCAQDPLVLQAGAPVSAAGPAATQGRPAAAAMTGALPVSFSAR